MKIVFTKQCTVRRPTLTGCLLGLTLFLVLILGIGSNIYPFLAPNKPPHHGLLVVEGWVSDLALDEVVKIYREGRYSKIICAGSTILTGSYLQQFKSTSEMTKARLFTLGIEESEIITAVGDESKRDRTYSAAIAMRKQLNTKIENETSIHLVSTGSHGRRSRLLFQKALGKDYEVGITSLKPSDYEPDQWFSYSQGVRDVIGELIAYTYARFLFHP